jgi:Family of unknown function (DUF5519)
LRRCTHLTIRSRSSTPSLRPRAELERSAALSRRRAGQIGHLHGDHAAHFSFPKDVWAELKAQGRIVAHPVFPDAEGPAARRIEDQADVREVIALLRRNYDRAVARHGLPVQAEA